MDDYTRSSVNSAVQSCENHKPHTLDVFAGMCMRPLRKFLEKASGSAALLTS